jgi:hypothetical protein
MTDKHDVVDISTTTDDFHCICCSRHASVEADDGVEDETDSSDDEDWLPTTDLPSDDESDDSNLDSCLDEM